MEQNINIEVAFAAPDKQLIVALSVPKGTLASDVVALSGIAEEFKGHDVLNAKIGLFGKTLSGAEAPDRYQVREGDRIEIYRPLISDPKEVRRRRAAEAAARQTEEKGD